MKRTLVPALPAAVLAALPKIALSIALLLIFGAAHVHAQTIEIDHDEGLFAIVTQKGGLGARLAHNHLIALRNPRPSIELNSSQPEATTFELSFRASMLSVDPWDLQQIWHPRLSELGLVDEAFTEISDKDRRKIRRSMLGGSQLDAQEHPEIRVSVAGITRTGTDEDFPYEIDLVIEAAGGRASRKVKAFYEARDRLRVEAYGSFNFTDLGIEPYSAFLGTVRNLDEFYVYLSLIADIPTADDE